MTGRAGAAHEGDLRPATVADAEAMARLHAAMFSPPWTADAMAGLLAHPGASAHVVLRADGSALAAMVVGRIAADEAEVLTLGVEAAARRAGLARRLIETLAADARRRGARRLFLEVAAGNVAAVALYGRAGFGEVGRRRGYYREAGRPAEDALLLARDL